MTAHVYVTLKRTVLDPQGQTIQFALKKFGYTAVNEVRQGKFFQLKLADGLSDADAKAQVQKIAAEVLCNPVMEEFTFTLEA